MLEQQFNELFRTGPHVFHGGFSTFLAVIVFANTHFAFILTFFKVKCFEENNDLLSQVMVLLVSMGLFHSLVALPALLSLIGPPTRA